MLVLDELRCIASLAGRVMHTLHSVFGNELLSALEEPYTVAKLDLGQKRRFAVCES